MPIVDKAWFENARKKMEAKIVADGEASLNYQRWHNREFKVKMDITTKFEYKSFSVEVTDTFTSANQYDQWLTEMIDRGFTKPTYKKNGQDAQEFLGEQWGTVKAVTKTDKLYNNKPLFAVSITLENGQETSVNKFDKNLFRVGDKVWYHKNKKGYADIALEKEDGDNIPF